MLPLVVVAAALLGVVVSATAQVSVHRLGLGQRLRWPPPAPDVATALLGGASRTVVAGVAVRTRPNDRVRPSWTLHLAMALLWGGLALRVGATPELPALLVLATLLVVVSIVDVAVRRIPNAYVYPAVPVLVALLTAAAVSRGEPTRVLVAVGCGLGVLVVLVGIVTLTPAGIGMGDVKLLAVVALVLGHVGWALAVAGVVVALVVATLGAAALVVTRRRGPREVVAFGPGIAVGALVVVLVAWPIG